MPHNCPYNFLALLAIKQQSIYLAIISRGQHSMMKMFENSTRSKKSHWDQTHFEVTFELSFLILLAKI